VSSWESPGRSAQPCATSRGVAVRGQSRPGYRGRGCGPACVRASLWFHGRVSTGASRAGPSPGPGCLRGVWAAAEKGSAVTTGRSWAHVTTIVNAAAVEALYGGGTRSRVGREVVAGLGCAAGRSGITRPLVCFQLLPLEDVAVSRRSGTAATLRAPEEHWLPELATVHPGWRGGASPVDLWPLGNHTDSCIPKNLIFSWPLSRRGGKFILFSGQPSAMNLGRNKRGRYLFLFIFFRFLHWLVCNMIQTCTVCFLGTCPH